MRLRRLYVLLLPWVLSTNIRYVFGQPQDFGTQQYLEYTRYFLPAAGLYLLFGILLFYSIGRPFYVRKIFLFPVFFLVASAAASQNPALSFYWVFLLTIYGLGAFVLVRAFHADTHLQRIFIKSLYVALFAQAGLGIFQFTSGHSLGVPFLGEPVATDATAGVAKLIIDGKRVLRPFGTFSHSNIFAGFLVITILATILNYASNLSRESVVRFSKSFHVGISAIALLVSYSRSAWAAITAGLLVISTSAKGIWVTIRIPVLIIGIAVVIGYPGITGRFNLSQQSSQLEIRSTTMSQALDTTFNKPLLGFGPRSFVNYRITTNSGELKTAPHKYQPVHNIYLLLAAEIGIPFTLFAMLAMIYLLFKLDPLGRSILVAIVVISCFDHYFLTTTSGIGVLILAILLCTPKAFHVKTKSRSIRESLLN